MLTPYPKEFLESAQIIVDRLRDDASVTSAKAIHAVWHLAGYGLGHLAADEVRPSTEEIPWLFGAPNTMPVPAGLAHPVRERSIIAADLEAMLLADELEVGSVNWLAVLKVLWEVLMLFLTIAK